MYDREGREKTGKQAVRDVAIIGAVTAVVSELYVNVFVSNFRVSPAVILYPLLLLTVGQKNSPSLTGGVTAAIILLFRGSLSMAAGVPPLEALVTAIPGAVFYWLYSILFCGVVKDRSGAEPLMTAKAAFLSEALSNTGEVCLRILLGGGGAADMRNITVRILAIAAVRTVFVYVFWYCAKWYRSILLVRENQEKFRHIYQMVTGLRSEIYLMHQNSEQIERVMGDAYSLYENLREQNSAEKMQRQSLNIARSVHEIKKDYFRIIQGIEIAIGQDENQSQMDIRELVSILEQTVRNTCVSQNMDIHFKADVREPFMTGDHYSIMSILNNLTNNSIEAIAREKGKGNIRLEEYRDGEQLVLTVSDDGPGISERHLRHIFQMGYSTKFDRETGSAFRGVGLNGVKYLVEEHFGGRISVESEPGKGTCFRIEVPWAALENGRKED